MITRARLLLPLAWRNLWRNPRRTIITVLVVSTGLWSVLTLAVVLHALSASSRDTTLKLMTGEGEIHAAGYRDDPTAAHRMPPPGAVLARMLHNPDVESFAARVRVSAIIQSEYKTLPVTLAGVVPADERKMSVIPSQIAAGRYLNGPGDSAIVLGRDLATRLKTRVGKRVVVMTQSASGQLAERSFRVVGLFTGPLRAEDDFIFTGIQTAQAFAGIGNDISEIAFNATNDAALPGLINALHRTAPNLDVQSWKELAPLPFAITAYVDLILVIWLGIAVSLVTSGIVNTQLMAVFERTREFGLLQALGMRPRLVLLEVALESMWLNSLGVALGVTAAIASVAAFPNGLELGFLARGAEIFGGGDVLHLRVSPADFIQYSLLIWVLGVAATLWPARRASKVSPVEAMSRT
jgi:ABC-type lipoprotein release transport system permease subunit